MDYNIQEHESGIIAYLGNKWAYTELWQVVYINNYSTGETFTKIDNVFYRCVIVQIGTKSIDYGYDQLEKIQIYEEDKYNNMWNKAIKIVKKHKGWK